MATFRADTNIAERLEKRLRKSTPSGLNAAGAYIRAVAIRVLGGRKTWPADTPSAPGKPPHSHQPTPFARTIAFGVIKDEAVVVGAELRGGGIADLARLHEFGGVRYHRTVDGRIKPITYAPRPYMKRALDIASNAKALPEAFRGILK